MSEVYKEIAYYSEGLEGIYIINIVYGIDDYIIWRYSTDKFIHRTKIYTDRNGDSYFKCYGRKIYLRDCLRL